MSDFDPMKAEIKTRKTKNIDKSNYNRLQAIAFIYVIIFSLACLVVPMNLSVAVSHESEIKQEGGLEYKFIWVTGVHKAPFTWIYYDNDGNRRKKNIVDSIYHYKPNKDVLLIELAGITALFAGLAFISQKRKFE